MKKSELKELYQMMFPEYPDIAKCPSQPSLLSQTENTKRRKSYGKL